MTGDIKTAIEPIESLQTEWTDLLNRSLQNNLFLTWEWMNSWNIHMLRETETALIITAREENRLIGIAPLVRQHHRFLGDRFMLLGQQYSYHLGFIAEEGREEVVFENLIKELFNVTGKKFSQLGFLNLSENGTLKETLLKIAKRSGFLAEAGTRNQCRVLPLPASFQEYLTSGFKSKNLAANLRGNQNKLEREHTYTFQIASDKNFDQIWQEMLTLHRGKMKFENRYSVLQNNSFPDHLRNVSEIYLATKLTRLGILKINTETAAVLLGIIYGDCYYALTIGINHKIQKQYKWLNICVLTHSFIIKDAIENRCKEFDFLGGDHDFKSKMGGREIVGLNIEIYRSRFQKYFVNVVSNVADNIKHNFVKRQKSFQR